MKKKERGGSQASVFRCCEKLYLTLLVVFCLLSLALLTLNVRLQNGDADVGIVFGRVLDIGDSVARIISGEVVIGHSGDSSVAWEAGTKEGLFMSGTGNGWSVWSSSERTLGGNEEGVDYLAKMFPAAEVLNVSGDNIVTKPWCNGVEISVEEVKLKVGFVRGRPIYVFDVGYWSGSWEECPWCYDGVRDYDEEGVDCGGTGCKTCIKREDVAVSDVGMHCSEDICEEDSRYGIVRYCSW
jgi:hypothetical protein